MYSFVIFMLGVSCFFYVWVFYLHICLYTSYMNSSVESEEDMGSPRAGITFGCELTCWCWELNLDVLEEQSMFHTLSHWTLLLVNGKVSGIITSKTKI